MDHKKKLLEALSGADKILVGIGGEWKLRDDGKDIRLRCLEDEAQRDLKEAYGVLWGLVRDKDYYVVTTVTDGSVYETELDSRRIVAPCGNIHWRQCSRACTRDIWEEGEVENDICPHCGAPMTGNTISAETYIEEGYLPGWEAYKKWQTGTLNRKLVILELGEGFKSPTVIRWPFEKIAFFNRKSSFYRINENFYQMPKEMAQQSREMAEQSRETAEQSRETEEQSRETADRFAGIQGNSVSFIRGLAMQCRETAGSRP